MGLLARLLEGRALGGAAGTPSQPSYWLQRALGGPPTASGKRITEETALQVSTVYACVRILAEAIGTLPLVVYRRRADGGKERAPMHPLYKLLHDKPNPLMGSVAWREAGQGHAALWGNAYSQVVRDTGGRVVALFPLRPDRVRVQHEGGGLAYYHQGGTGPDKLIPDVLHVRGMSPDGVMGYGPIRLSREAVGLANAAEEYGARVFAGDGSIAGVLKHPGSLSEAAQKRLQASWQEKHSGLHNAHKVAILEEGLEWQAVGMPPEDLQYLELRRFQRTEIAALFGVPPHRIGALENATFSNIEHQSISWVVDSVRPWCVRWESALNALFPDDEQGEFFCEFLLDGLLRGDLASRYQAYAVGRTNGWLSADDIRALENMNPLPDGTGTMYLVPLNMVPADQVGKEPAAPQPQAGRSLEDVEQRATDGATARERLGRRYRRLILDATNRLVKREVGDIRTGARRLLVSRSEAVFSQWAADYYRDFPAVVERTLYPAFLTYGEDIGDVAASEVSGSALTGSELERYTKSYTAGCASYWAGKALGQVQRVVRKAVEAGEDPLAALEQRLDEWADTKADKIADGQTVRAGNSATRETWRRNGVTRIRWRTSGANCPYCSRMNGRVVGIEQPFLMAGEGIEAEGRPPMKVGGTIRHPPAHGRCNCSISPG